MKKCIYIYEFIGTADFSIILLWTNFIIMLDIFHFIDQLKLHTYRAHCRDQDRKKVTSRKFSETYFRINVYIFWFIEIV